MTFALLRIVGKRHPDPPVPFRRSDAELRIDLIIDAHDEALRTQQVSQHDLTEISRCVRQVCHVGLLFA